MEYRKTKNLLNNTLNQPAKFRTKNWVVINNKSHGTYNTNSQIKFKTSMLRSHLYDYSHAYILVSGTIAVENTSSKSTSGAAVNNPNIEVLFKNCVP